MLTRYGHYLVADTLAQPAPLPELSFAIGRPWPERCRWWPSVAGLKLCGGTPQVPRFDGRRTRRCARLQDGWRTRRSALLNGRTGHCRREGGARAKLEVDFHHGVAAAGGDHAKRRVRCYRRGAAWRSVRRGACVFRRYDWLGALA